MLTGNIAGARKAAPGDDTEAERVAARGSCSVVRSTRLCST